MEKSQYGIKKIARRFMCLFFGVVLILVLLDFYRFLILVRRVKAVENLVGVRRENVAARIEKLSSEWGCEVEIRNRNSEHAEWCVITISKPRSLIALLFSDYTNLLMINFDDGHVSSVLCCQ